MNEEFIRIRIGGYEADIPAASLPDWPVLKFRRLLKLIRDPYNTRPEEWERMEEHLKTGLAAAGSKMEQAKAYYAKRYCPVAGSARGAAADWRRKYNRALESDVKQAEKQVKHWKKLKTIYDKERNKRR